jgi:hypothetical protein
VTRRRNSETTLSISVEASIRRKLKNGKNTQREGKNSEVPRRTLLEIFSQQTPQGEATTNEFPYMHHQHGNHDKSVLRLQFL